MLEFDQRSLVMQFESLGGNGHGCEFGIFQRSLGAEPLGLLRWADLNQDQIASALETEFSGVGDPEFTHIFVPTMSGRPEYWTTDSRHHMAMRCFVYPDEVPIEQMAHLTCQRFRFLREKMLRDLREGSKIFVYKSMKRNLTDAELNRLYRAVQSYGETTLLYIRYQDQEHPNGTVELARRGLMIGFVDHFSHTPDTDEFIGPAHKSFLAICMTAYELWRSGQTTNSAIAATSHMATEIIPTDSKASVDLLAITSLADGLAAVERATSNGNADSALNLLLELRESFPERLMLTLRAVALLVKFRRFDEAEALLMDAKSRFADDPAPLIDWAWVAHHRREWEEAVRRWEGLRARFPLHLMGYVGAAHSLRELTRFDEAEALLAAAIERHPDNAAPMIDFAWVANQRREWTTAISRWDRVRQSFPRHSAGYTGAAQALRELRRTDEAEALLVAAMIMFPNDAAPAIDHAWLANHRQDWIEASRRWELVQGRFPKHVAVYIGLAQCMRETQRLIQAEELLSAAMRTFPDEPAPLIEYAWVAHHRRDWLESNRRWDSVRHRYPQHISGYTGGAHSLIELGHFDQAEALLHLALEQFPNDAGANMDFARVAQARRNWSDAQHRWEGVLERFPRYSAGYLGVALCLREKLRFDEADSLLRRAIERFPHELGPLNDYAWVANARRDWQEAIVRWNAVKEKFPERVEPNIRIENALRELWRFKEAEDLLSGAMKRFPNEPELACDFAWIAFHENKLGEAARRFVDVRTRFPNEPAGYVGFALVLRNQFQRDKSEALLQEAMERFPNVPNIALEYAQLPMFSVWKSEKNPQEALLRIRNMMVAFPDFERGYLNGSRLLREAEQFDAAEEIAMIGVSRLPWSAELAAEHARIAIARSDLNVAIDRYSQIQQKFPDDPNILVGLASALARAGQLGVAEVILRGAIEKFPSHPPAFAEYARVAVRKQDWSEAVRRWMSAQSRFPDDRDIRRETYEAQMRLSDTESAPAPIVKETQERDIHLNETQAETNSDKPVDNRRQLRDLALQFESLGGKGLGCEFGIFQRDCGAEPLGLLRWAEMVPDKLIWALENKFDGVGIPENTKLFVDAAHGRPEYCTVDLREMMFMRTFVYEDELPHDKMFRQVCRRIQYLKNKFVADLEAGAKIFVYKIVERNLADEELHLLHNAMRSYGNNTLLYVRYETEACGNGMVELVKPGLMVGYIDRFKLSRTGELSSAPPTASWAAICRKAYDLWQRGVAIPAVAKAEKA